MTKTKAWNGYVAQELSHPNYQHLHEFVAEEYSHHAIFPPLDEIFHAFDLCPFDRIKAVILGQDPYPTRGMAHGLAFSVKEGRSLPASLKNIFQEIQSEYGYQRQKGNLQDWSKQGVFLLNAILTVREGQPLSHQGQGWEEFTDTVLQKISAEKEHVVFVLWGRQAQAKERWIDHQKHLVLKSAHPSPLSAHRGFFGSNVFRKVNEQLEQWGYDSIQW
ncbi:MULTISPECIES: uracil-DNA glycosylase [Terrabacteria group]|uniref:uracil-DNA glycosylase n=1 Tax=Bacillati TaxID=1783272 RepID=UPI001C6E8037|nr:MULTISPECIES: uracil-DNA glycosylase [Terrabacteria group]MBW9212610.1 uracil-DNA glycosylase [Trueperella sp. zg.1013]